MKKAILTATSALLFLSGCSDSDKGEQDFLYHADIKEVEDSVACSDLVDSVAYIKLETNEKCRIGEINQLLVANDKLYVVSDGIYCFDMEGRHLFSIDQRGHAKNEYVRIRSVNVFGDKLFLYDNMSAKALTFDANTGAYIDCTMLPNEMASAYGLKDHILIDRMNFPEEDLKGNGRFVLCPKTDIGDMSEGYFSGDEYNFPIEGTVSTFSRGIFFSSYFNCMAWALTDNGCKKYLKLDVPSDMKLPKSAISRAINDRSFPKDADGYVYGLANIAESGDFITGRLSYDKKFLHFIYDKKSGNTRCYGDVVEMERWQFAPISFRCGDGKSLFCVYSSDEIVMIRDLFGAGKAPSDRSLRNYEIYCSEEETDNPIVARFYLKHF